MIFYLLYNNEDSKGPLELGCYSHFNIMQGDYLAAANVCSNASLAAPVVDELVINPGKTQVTLSGELDRELGNCARKVRKIWDKFIGQLQTQNVWRSGDGTDDENYICRML